MTGAATSSREGERGFTLLELALTIAVMAIILTIALPRLPRLGRSELEASADRLAATMTYLADEASLRGRIYRLTLDFDEDRWDVAALAPYATREGADVKPEFRVDPDDPLAESRALPRGVAFDSVVDQSGETTSGKRPVFFLPEGPAGNVDVRLLEDEGASVVIHLDAARSIASRGETQEERR